MALGEFPHATAAANGGLRVAQMMINNWDFKTSNNKIVERADQAATPRRFDIVRDLGASLGSNEQTKWLRWTQLRISQGSKNDLPGFEESGFIDGVEDRYVKFSSSGPNKPLVSRLTPAHVRWAASLMSRLSDKQWHDAFRAGGYPQEDAARFIATFKKRSPPASRCNSWVHVRRGRRHLQPLLRPFFVPAGQSRSSASPRNWSQPSRKNRDRLSFCATRQHRTKSFGPPFEARERVLATY